MAVNPITWTALVCPVRGAGAYVGLASCRQQATVAEHLFPKRAVPYTGAAVCLRWEEHWPLMYLAVRDPSAARVIPMEEPRRRGYPRVRLRFAVSHGPLFAPARHQDAALDQLRAAAAERRPGAFVVTIGLPIALEPAFHRRVLLNQAAQPWRGLCLAVSGFRPR
jgi:hypothetical protein